MYSLPGATDAPLWNIYMSTVTLPSLMAAVDVGLFDQLAKAPATTEELADRLQVNHRAIRALLPLFTAARLLVQRAGRYHLNETARCFLIRESPFFWGPVFELSRRVPATYDVVIEQLRASEQASQWDLTKAADPTNAWSEGQIAPEVAKAVASYMHAASLPAATVLAHRLDLSATRQLLDVGAGSGSFSIAMAQANPALRCTLMDLKGMCDVAMEYVREGGVLNRVTTCPVDMFRDSWPRGHDAIFFSNVFHDWNFDTCAQLARKAFEALPAGGQILLHEMLLDDTHDGPLTAAAFSVYMLLSTKGQQFTTAELTALLSRAGFTHIHVVPTHEHYAVIRGRKPG